MNYLLQRLPYLEDIKYGTQLYYSLKLCEIDTKSIATKAAPFVNHTHA